MAGSGSTDDFTEFVLRVEPALRNHALALCGDWHEAEDLTQITWMKLYSRWETLTNVDHKVAYTHQTMFNAFLAERRHVRWQREELFERLPELWTPNSEILEYRLLLIDALERLGPRQRAVVVLRIWEDCSIDQTMEILQCSAATVRSQLARAISKLRDAMVTALQGLS